jgi:hypothetical protein
MLFTGMILEAKWRLNNKKKEDKTEATKNK